MRPTTEPRSEKSSTQPEPDSGDAQEISDDLLERFKSVDDKKLARAERAISAYSEDDDAHDKRWGKAETRRTFYKIRRWFFWFLFVLTCALIAVCSIGYLILVGVWVSNVVWGTKLADPDGLKEIISDVLWTLLVIAATLFGESVFKDDDK